MFAHASLISCLCETKRLYETMAPIAARTITPRTIQTTITVVPSSPGSSPGSGRARLLRRVLRIQGIHHVGHFVHESLRGAHEWDDLGGLQTLTQHEYAIG